MTEPYLYQVSGIISVKQIIMKQVTKNNDGTQGRTKKRTKTAEGDI